MWGLNGIIAVLMLVIPYCSGAHMHYTTNPCISRDIVRKWYFWCDFRCRWKMAIKIFKNIIYLRLYNFPILFSQWYSCDIIQSVSWQRYVMETLSVLLDLCEDTCSHIPHRSLVDPSQRASDAELWCILCSYNEQTVEQTVDLSVIWDAMILIWCHCNGGGNNGLNTIIHLRVRNWWCGWVFFYEFLNLQFDPYVIVSVVITRLQAMSGQATGLDAWASRVKCPARFVSHLHEICIYMSCL